VAGAGEEKVEKDESNKKIKGESPILVTLDGHTLDVRELKSKLLLQEKERQIAEANANVYKISLTEVRNQLSEMKKSNESLKEDLKTSKEAARKLEANEQINKETATQLRKATESFVYRVKDFIKLPSSSSTESSETKKSSASKKASASEVVQVEGSNATTTDSQ